MATIEQQALDYERHLRIQTAIDIMREHKRTHEAWAKRITEFPDELKRQPDVGDVEHHKKCLNEYDLVLSVLQPLLNAPATPAEPAPKSWEKWVAEQSHALKNYIKEAPGQPKVYFALPLITLAKSALADVERLKTCGVIECMLANPNVDSWVREHETRLEAALAKVATIRRETLAEVRAIVKEHLDMPNDGSQFHDGLDLGYTNAIKWIDDMLAQPPTHPLVNVADLPPSSGATLPMPETAPAPEMPPLLQCYKCGLWHPFHMRCSCEALIPPTPAERVILDATAANEKLKARIAELECRLATIPREALEELLRWAKASPFEYSVVRKINEMLSRESSPTPEPAKCRACGKPLLRTNYCIADGCPCNAERGINHRLVPPLVCTCTVCDPDQTGASRWPRPDPVKPFEHGNAYDQFSDLAKPVPGVAVTGASVQTNEEFREGLGRRVREVWIMWAKEQSNPKSSWLLPWEELSETNKEADRRIGAALWGDGFNEAEVEVERLTGENRKLKSDLDAWPTTELRAANARLNKELSESERTRNITLAESALAENAKLKAELATAKEEGKKDYDGMRDMQRKFMVADHAWRETKVELAEANAKLSEWEERFKRHEPETG